MTDRTALFVTLVVAAVLAAGVLLEWLGLVGVGIGVALGIAIGRFEP